MSCLHAFTSARKLRSSCNTRGLLRDASNMQRFIIIMKIKGSYTVSEESCEVRQESTSGDWGTKVGPGPLDRQVNFKKPLTETQSKGDGQTHRPVFVICEEVDSVRGRKGVDWIK